MTAISPQIRLLEARIDSDAVARSVQTTAAGAVVLFLGTVREFTDGRRTVRLGYDAYREMAIAQMNRLAEEAAERWPLTGIAMEHRLGELELGEVSVAIAVSSPHRDAAFQAARYLIDEVKQRVPIWKAEHWADGSREWVHPGGAPEGEAP